MIIKEFLPFKGIYEIELEEIIDNRGHFKRVYDENIFRHHNLTTRWVQESHSVSTKKNTIRGMHFQFPPHTETKIVRVIKGEIYDVFIDLRKDSPTFGKYGSIILSDSNNKMIYIPRGFAHGFRTLIDRCEVLYKVDKYYSPENEGGIKWDDPDIKIDWKYIEELYKLDKNIIISKKDSNQMSFKYFIQEYCHNSLISFNI